VSDHIILDPKLGVNPRLTYCQRCVVVKGKDPNAVKKEDQPNDGPDLMLMGNKGYVDTCQSCGFKHYGGAPKAKNHAHPYEPSKACVRCGNGNFNRRKLADWERIPSMEPCEECKKELEVENAHIKEVIESGGIYWKCESCLRTGVLRADHELSREVREKTDIAPPNPVGVKMNSKECPFCRTEN
jgi:hypothetical protein